MSTPSETAETTAAGEPRLTASRTFIDARDEEAHVVRTAARLAFARRRWILECLAAYCDRHG